MPYGRIYTIIILLILTKPLFSVFAQNLINHGLTQYFIYFIIKISSFFFLTMQTKKVEGENNKIINTTRDYNWCKMFLHN